MKISAIITAAMLAANVTVPAAAPKDSARISVPQAIVSPAPENVRVAEGVVRNFSYWDDLDVIKCEIETEDGHVWNILDYVAPRETDVIVTFDTHGTDDVTDDEIIEIINICEFAR